MKFKTSYLFEEEKSNKEIETQFTENKNIYHYNFDIKYDIIKPIIKDFQMVSQLIKFIKDYQISDLIFIQGNNTYSKDSIFYFNYRKIIDFYSLVLDFQERDNFLKIEYYVYKTKPICKKFKIIFSLFECEKKAKLEIEIIPNNGIIISEKYLNIIYNEFDYNFLYLSLALKLKKEKLIHFNSGIINNEFPIISQIIQNIKIIGYIINRKFIHITNEKTDDEKFILNKKDKYIHLNEIYKMNLRKQKGDIPEKYIILKIINFKSRDDVLDIKLKILSFSNKKEINDSNDNSLYNIISIKLRKITKNSSFILIKCIFNPEHSDDNGILIKKFLNKFLCKIQKLSGLNL
jgi:hypothetical protein